MTTEKKIAILIGDGMADYPIESRGNKTALQIAKTPHMDYMAKNGVFGLVKTVPDGMSPGSDTAILSIFGYDPRKYYTGRAPLEAISMGIKLGERDVAYRCNIVQIDETGVMVDFSAGHIDTAFTEVVVEELKKNIKIDSIELFPGVSYRNILIWRDYPYSEIADATPPHDIQGKAIRDYLPQGDGSELLIEIMELSQEIMRGSTVIKRMEEKYRGNPTSVWLWGGGRRPQMSTLEELYGLNGYTISAVDLVHGIGRAAGLSRMNVEGATGYIDTNYRGKAQALIEAMKQVNFVFLHVESPDESGHEGNLEHKIKAIEDFDEKVVGIVLDEIRTYDDFTILVMPDHRTPICLRTHTADPVPFCIYRSKDDTSYRKDTDISGFDEFSATRTGIFLNDGYKLMDILIRGGL
jgi:2,3-bisphosphoglycerate-independent phosphoglycerate mutase